MRTTDSLRTTYGETLVELGKENKDIVMLEADLGNSTMSSLFWNAHPERYFQMGIAEQNMASVAAGLALAGRFPSSTPLQSLHQEERMTRFAPQSQSRT